MLSFTFKDERRKENECRKSAWCILRCKTEHFGVGGKETVKRKLGFQFEIMIYRSQLNIQEWLFQLGDEYYSLYLQRAIWPGYQVLEVSSPCNGNLGSL